MLPEFPSAARTSEYVCDLEYLFSRMNVGSYGATDPHLWLMSKIPQCTWDDCRASSERKSRTHSCEELVDLLIELALEREKDSDMEKFLKKHFGQGGTPAPECGKGKGPKNPINASQGGGKGRGNLSAMNEVKPDAGTPPLFYCKPVNHKGGPYHAPDCDHRSSCMLQMKRQQHSKDGKTVTHQDHFRCSIIWGCCGKRRHYEDECHIKKRESDKLKRQEAERQKNCKGSSDSTQILHQCDQNFNDSQMYISAVNFPLVFMFSVRRQMSPVSARRVAFVFCDFPIGFI